MAIVTAVTFPVPGWGNGLIESFLLIIKTIPISEMISVTLLVLETN